MLSLIRKATQAVYQYKSKVLINAPAFIVTYGTMTVLNNLKPFAKVLILITYSTITGDRE